MVTIVSCQIVHLIPHRIRIRIPRLFYDAKYARQLQRLAASLDFVTDIRINAAASSLIVHHLIVDTAEAWDQLNAIIQNAVTAQIPEIAVENPPTQSIHLGGVGWMLLATGSFAGMQTIVRLTAVNLNPLQVAFVSHFFSIVILAPWSINAHVLKTEKFHLHGFRAIIEASATMLMFTGLTLIPLAQANALLFTAPLFAMLGATLFLGEQIKPPNVISLLLGLVGMLVILRPGVEVIGVGSLFILMGAVGLAGSMLFLKLLTRTDSSLTSTAYSFLLMTPLMLIPALWVWQLPTLLEVLGLVLVGALMVSGNMAVAKAFESADLTAVLPVNFTQLIWSSILGYLLFAEIPDLWIWIGGLLIFAGSILTAQAESAQQAESF